MHGLRIFSILLLPTCGGFVLALALSAATRPERFPVPWEPVAVVFGATLGYALVLTRRPRRLRGGTYFLVAGTGWLAAAAWARANVADTGRPLLLFITAGANLAGGLLADDGPGGVLRRSAPWLEAHLWSASLAVGGAVALLAGGVDVATQHDPGGALLRGVAWVLVGTLLHRFTLAVIFSGKWFSGTLDDDREGRCERDGRLSRGA